MQKSLPYLNIYETEEPPADMIDEYNETHAEKVEETEEGTEGNADGTETESDEPIIDPQTGEVVTKPEIPSDGSVDPETGILMDPTQDDDYPSDILTNVQPSIGEVEGLGTSKKPSVQQETTVEEPETAEDTTE